MMQYLAAIVAALLLGCHARPQVSPERKGIQTMQTTEVYRGKIAQISREVRSLSVPDELFASKPFVEIYEAPQPYLAAAGELVCDATLSVHEKQIAAYSMQNLPTGEFLSFAGRVLACVQTQATPWKVLETTAFPLLNIGRQRLIVHYADPRVKSFLEHLAALKELPDPRREYIRNQILTGKARQDYATYLEMLGRTIVE